MTTNPYLRGLLYANHDKPISPLVHIFLYITFAFGLSFVVFADPSGASQTVLYKLTEIYFGSYATNLWGLLAVGTTLLNTYAYMVRSKWLGPKATFLGIIVWGYSFFVYLFGGFIFGALVSSLPNLGFWFWQYVKTKQYYRTFQPGPLKDASYPVTLDTSSK